MCSHINYSKLELLAGTISLNNSAKIKTTIREIKFVWGNSFRVTEDKRNVIMYKLFINK
jgi:hypothetical protein